MSFILTNPQNKLKIPSDIATNILSVIAIIGMVRSFLFKGQFHKLIAIGQLIGMLVFLLRIPHAATVGFWILSVLSAVTFYYGIKENGLDTIGRVSVVAMGLALTVKALFSFNLWPGAGVVGVLMIIAVILTLIDIIRTRGLSKEMCFMSFWFVFAVSAVIRDMMY
jgi:hypothetical protein